MPAHGWRGLPHRRWVLIPLIIVGLLIAIRAVLPIFVTDYVNKVMNRVPGFRGTVADIDLHLWRGAYTIHGLELSTVEEGKKPVPVLKVARIEIAIEWRALLHGAIVGEFGFYQPKINIVTGAAKKEGKSTDNFIDQFKKLTPLDINRFTIVDGELHFVNFAASPDVDIYLDRVQLTAQNFTNSQKLSKKLPATVAARGRAMKSGEFTLEMQVAPLEKSPTYELAFELKNLHLPELNTFLRHYLSVEARDGYVSLYVESDAADGKFRGYAKPLTRQLDILHIPQDKKKGVIETVKGFFVKIVANLFENKAKNQLATKVPFSGSFENPDISIWEAVTSFLRNAFIQALSPALEGSVAPGQKKKLERDESQQIK
jgi:hypothetical protein